MARIPYDPVADVLPQTRAPDDYQRIETNPGQFGALIGQGAQKLGAGITAGGKFWQGVQTDDVVNNYLKEGDAIVQQAKTLRGADYLSAQSQINKQLDDLNAKYKSQLVTPGQQLQFDTNTRPYRDRYWAGQLSTHADEQAYSYATDTNNQAFQQATSMAATSFNNPAQLAVAQAKARQSQYKNVQLNGQENNPDAVNAAAQRADQAVFKTAVQSMAVSDPIGAKALADKHQGELGAEYAPLVDSIQERVDSAKSQRGAIDATNSATQSLHTDIRQNYNDPDLPIFAQTAQTVPGGFSPQGLARTVQIESAGNPHADNGIAKGLGQFTKSTWAKFGQGSPFDPTESIAATQRYAAFNAPILQQGIGHAPTDAELYLAHQQGVGGAIKLLNNPNVRAGNLVGDAAIRENGGDPDAPASAFTSMWTAKFGGSGVPTVTPGGGQTMTMPAVASGASTPIPSAQPTPSTPIPSAQPAPTSPAPPAAPQPMPTTPLPTAPSPEAILARGVQAVQANPDLTSKQQEGAIRILQQNYAAAQIANEANAAAQKKQVEQAANEYLTGMMQGQVGPDVISKIADDPRLAGDWNTKKALWDLAIKSASGDNGSLGTGFDQAYKRILAKPGDPSQITSVDQILAMGLPDENGAVQLSHAGVQRAMQIYNESRKSADARGLQVTKQAAVDSAKRYLDFSVNDGFIKRADVKGEDIFDRQFMPQFEASYDKWVSEKNDPYKFPLFDTKNMDALLQKLRPQRERDADYVAAGGEPAASQDLTASPGAAPLPPAPEGVDPIGWRASLAEMPQTKAGAPLGVDRWADALRRLYAVRNDPQSVANFDKYMGPGRGRRLINQLEKGMGAIGPHVGPQDILPEVLAAGRHVGEALHEYGEGR
jgi:hypothetical protein